MPLFYFYGLALAIGSLFWVLSLGRQQLPVQKLMYPEQTANTPEVAATHRLKQMEDLVTDWIGEKEKKDSLMFKAK